uniref:Interleukin-1 n=1 Tax=Castor canadensis TaxID=51338 RepID=A0A8B7TJJ6_CASCN|nr:interleukin-36 beta-like [Castor canadensis]
MEKNVIFISNEVTQMLKCQGRDQQLIASSPSSDHLVFPTESFEANMSIPELQEMPRSYGIHDSQQMVWVLNGNSLIAVPSSSNVNPVTLDLIACRDTEFQDEAKGNLVFLGIKGKGLSLFCTEIQGQPTLQLKEINIMDLYKEKKAQKPFLFFHDIEGSTSVFQSVAYPGWFIGTSSVARQPIILTQERGETNNTNFYLYPKNYNQPVISAANSRIKNQAFTESFI